jgi:hypothetical protein
MAMTIPKVSQKTKDEPGWRAGCGSKKSGRS